MSTTPRQLNQELVQSAALHALLALIAQRRLRSLSRVVSVNTLIQRPVFVSFVVLDFTVAATLQVLSSYSKAEVGIKIQMSLGGVSMAPTAQLV